MSAAAAGTTTATTPISLFEMEAPGACLHCQTTEVIAASPSPWTRGLGRFFQIIGSLVWCVFAGCPGARIEPLLPDRTPRRGGRWRDHRQVIDAIAFTYRTGRPWMDLPEHFGL
nr:transposase [Streptomyces sp. TLI_105]